MLSTFLLKDTPEDLWAISVKHPTAQEQLIPLSASSDGLPTLRILIAYADQLHTYVRQVPSLAWELLEHAQEPLEIVYPERKLPVYDIQDIPGICVRWVKHPKLATFLQKRGPMWAVRAPSLSKAPPPFSTVDCYHTEYPYQRVKTVAIQADNTFSFLR